MRTKVWKLIGIAGIMSVAATGALVARNQKERRRLTPEEVRTRLQERYKQVQ